MTHAAATKADVGAPGDYLVIGDSAKPSTWHLRVKRDGKTDPRLLGAAHAALTVGYRGNKYEGPDAGKALAKLRALYKAEGCAWPGAEKRDVGEAALGRVEFTKVDDEQRLIFAWSTVISEGGTPVEDRQGDVIEADEMQKAYHRYMVESRLGNDMHSGPDTSVLVEGMCFTKARQDLLGIDLGKEGYFGVWKILDDDIWNKVKAGERPMLSIEGTATREDIPEAA